ncbi:RDD family protein [Poseidonibacter antarcticus]|uniref:RDD family protein n=1 Tax=Poseidonibacter antarcticus TaxID=2478538 RepID=UPI000EF49904|nr:RDD family protein [Poseidonibacter antarcticus]
MARWRDTKHNKNKEKSPISKEETIQVESSSISSRLRAFLTDTFLITTPILYIVIYLIMGSGEAFSQNRTKGWLIILFVHLLLIIFFWFVKNQTPGLKAYRLKIVDAVSKKRISLVQSLIRYAATLFAVVSFFLIFLPFIRKDKKTFQDLLSNTIIVHE